MSDTTIDTLPPPTEAMTARDLRAHQDAMREQLGASYTVSIDAGSRYHSSPASIYITDNKKIAEFFRADDWPAVIRLANQWIANHAVTARNTLIRNMALAIISLTDEHGTCTMAALERQGFARADITEHQLAACARAGEMAAGAPFEVVP